MKTTIGLLIEVEGTVDIEGYKTQLRSGITDQARNNEINLICFAGGALHRSPYQFSEKQRNIIFDLIHKNIIDGLIVVSTIVSSASIEEKEDFFQKIKSFPVIITGETHPYFPSIRINNKNAMKQLVQHLVNVHQFKKLAFIKGVKGHHDTEERFDAYAEALLDSGLDLDQNLIVDGNFLINSGHQAVQLLLDERKVKFDAIIASNDHMAYGAIEELKKRGYSIPSDIAVTGFDDSEKSTIVLPTLTTVRQSVYEMGKIACDLLVGLIKGEDIPMMTVLNSQIIYRQSCRCFTKGVVDLHYLPMEIKENNLLSNTMIEEVYHQFTKMFNDLIDYSCTTAKEILDKFIDQINKMENSVYSNDFLIFFNHILTRWNYTKKDPSVWNDILTALRNTLLGLFDCEKHILIENTIHQCRILILDATRQFISEKKIDSEMKFEKLNDIAKNLFSTLTIKSIVDVIEKEIDLLDIHTCFIVLYEKNDHKTDIIPPNSSLILAYYQGKKIFIPENEAVFATNKLLPETIRSRFILFSFLLEPLFFGKEQIGYVIMEQGPTNGFIYEQIRIHLSNSIYSALLFENRNIAEKKLTEALIELEKVNHELRDLTLTDELTGLYNRRGFTFHAEQYISMAKRNHSDLTIFFIDLDGLKKINDSYGHKEGDQAIITVAVILKKCFRKPDIIARIGGDEFTIITANQFLKCVDDVKNRINHRLEEFNKKNTKPYQLSLTIGYCNLYECHNHTLNELIQNADNVLYQLKREKKKNEKEL